MRKLLMVVFLGLAVASCNRKEAKTETEAVSRTSGEVKLLVDESFSNIIDDQMEVFRSDYPDAHFKLISGNEQKILPTFLNDSVRVMISSRMLTGEEQKRYTNRGISVRTTRFAIDGIALITSNDNPDSTITAAEVVSILKGTATSKRSLVFDNAYSSTVRYFKELAQINTLPKSGVYTLESNDDVIKYIENNKGFIGVVGVNWLLSKNASRGELTKRVKIMGVKALPGQKGDDQFYQPTQEHLISGKYPFLRNVYIINGEGKEGVGTGFANWLVSQRGQLIVLKSGLGPHELMPREFNLKN